MDGDLISRRRSATPADYHAAGRRAEAARQSLDTPEGAPASAPDWERSALPEAVAMGLYIEDDRRRDEALDKLRRAVRAWRVSGRDER